MRHTRPIALIVACIGALILFSGCTATPAQKEKMIVTGLSTRTTHDAALRVKVFGGQKSSDYISTITTDAFAQALIETIDRARMFKTVSASGDSSYSLEVIIEKIDQPTYGYDFTVRMDTIWRLYDGQSKQIAEEYITGIGQATTQDAFVGATRLQFANEAAGQDTIRRGLRWLDRVEIKN